MIPNSINEYFSNSATSFRSSAPLKYNLYQRNLNELSNTDKVLDRNTYLGDHHVANLKLQGYPVNTGIAKTVKDITNNTVKTQDLLKIQPNMLIKDIDYFYGEPYYWDWRYPAKMISVEFAKNPEKFCRDHPNTYPVPLINSRKKNYLVKL